MRSDKEAADGSIVHSKFVGINFSDESIRRDDSLELFFGYL